MKKGNVRRRRVGTEKVLKLNIATDGIDIEEMDLEG